ncbi:mothers against decapentaplegic homolog 6-like [Limulus polyphemus]|uniref:Mothers against decapentaplegic homolog n=1 Tax=Limulus polyphemus TaxID=6850 RepID=A0ABM1BVU7_LIMPO|nr:mothers against decapentaplegic homolog 6-like [Limulus polyphemus]
MFRSRRNALVKRLWKQRIVLAVADNEAVCKMESHQELEMKSVVHSVLKRLKEAQLEALVQAVESHGAEPSGCVLVPRGDLRLGRRTSPPHVICCQLWRWTDVWQPFELKSLHWCETANEHILICCNPFHWSRLYKPESPPPPYSIYPQDLVSPKDRAPREPVSMETGGSNQYGSYRSHPPGDSSGQFLPQPWCTLAYWELRCRAGRLFPVHKNGINVFYDLPQGNGLCLRTLTGGTTRESVIRSRQNIGLGITLWREGEGVWMYNRSQYPVFVNSPTLDLPNTRPLTVFKVLPGYSVKVFDFEKSKYYQIVENAKLPDGPFDHNAVRISFAKGWGPNYSRQCVTACPCWLEVMFTVAR